MDLGWIDSRPTLTTQTKTGPSGRFWRFRAEDEIRTRDLLLGKETLYQAEPLPRRRGIVATPFGARKRPCPVQLVTVSRCPQSALSQLPRVGRLLAGAACGGRRPRLLSFPPRQ